MLNEVDWIFAIFLYVLVTMDRYSKFLKTSLNIPIKAFFELWNSYRRYFTGINDVITVILVLPERYM